MEVSSGHMGRRCLHMEVDDGNVSFNAARTLLFLPEEGPGVISGHDGLCNR